MNESPRPLPDPEYADFAPFWEGTALGELRVPACDECGRNIWPPRMACPACACLGFTWRPIGNRGVLYSWTTVGRATLAGFEGEVPYTVVVVEAEADPRVRFVGLLDRPEVPVIDMPLVASFVLDRDVTLVHWRARAD